MKKSVLPQLLLVAISFASPTYSAEIQILLPWSIMDGPFLCTQENDDTPTHTGIEKYALDFDINRDTAITASASGHIYFFEANKTTAKAWGNHAKIDHGNGYFTLYAHLSWLNREQFSNGDWIDAGKVVGNAGNSGCFEKDGSPCGEHLHTAYYEGNASRDGWAQSKPSVYITRSDSGVAYLRHSESFVYGQVYNTVMYSNGVVHCGDAVPCVFDVGGAIPAQPANQVNLKIDFDILDVDGNELYAGRDTLGPMPVKLRVQVVAEHDNAGNWAKAEKKISIEYFARYDGGNWEEIGRGEMTIGELDKGRTIQETVTYEIPNLNTTHVEFKASIDTDDQVDEADEGDNKSRVEPFAFSADAPSLFRPDMVIEGLGITGGRATLTQGERFGLQAWAKNIGGRKSATSRMAYYLQAPGGGLAYVMDDGVDELNPGSSSYELTRNEPFTAHVGGWWQAHAVADYQGNVTESNESNNGLSAWFWVQPAMPDLVVEAMWLPEGGSFKKDTRVHPYCVVKNIGNGTAGPSRLAYYIDWNRFRDGDDVGSLCPGCSATENVNNNDIKLGDRGGRTYRCCVDNWASVQESNENNNCATINFTVR